MPPTAIVKHKLLNAFAKIQLNLSLSVCSGNGHPLVHFAGISSCASQHHASVSIEMLCGIRGLVFKR